MENGLDIVFVDGLHTYEQSLIDVQNALKYLNPGGVIIMHDCNPKDEISAYPGNSLHEVNQLNLKGWTNEWCGDVWKTIADLRSERSDLYIFVLDCDCGLGIITNGDPSDNLDFSKSVLKNLIYTDLEQDRENILNLMPVDYLDIFLSALP
ncbi:class I SAM-dependent methyltransferase [Candidatus Neomarinimicrobiota bacterium]